MVAQWHAQMATSLVWFPWGKGALCDHSVCECALCFPVVFEFSGPTSTNSDEWPKKLHENQWLHRGEKLILCLHHIKGCSTCLFTIHGTLEALYEGGLIGIIKG